ncbi:MAG: hypothetical protein BGN90_04330 [Acidovorax sp. 65-7]|uniref:diguanylate cyclase domain-containing protein n=1 Tax=Acidovorax sp. TaxID=1872122 RepID=UPI000968DD3C|nr:diguanylate cyclase [Acidovorax sp.]OJT98722.1 MAG: hypothetical protein BGN90_04330 [Acidovorax sp. 65-7]
MTDRPLALDSVMRTHQSCIYARICARIGGDEFVVICTQLEQANQAGNIAIKLLEELIAPISVESTSFVLGDSIGISLYPLHGNSLVEHA